MQRFLLPSLLAVILSAPAAMALDVNPCTPDRLEVADDGMVTCPIDLVITEADGKTFSQQTLGAVRSVRVMANLQVNPGLIGSYLQENGIAIPPQHIDFEITTSGTPVYGSMDIAPFIGIVATGAGVEATEARINATNFTSTLPDWIDRIIEKKVNSAADRAIQEPARNLVRNLNK